MKKLIIYTCLGMLLVSCNKLLEENPKSIAVETYYTSTANLERAVNAIYNPIRGTNGFGTLYLAQFEAYTDYSFGRGSYGPLSDFQGLDATNITRTDQIWHQFYRAVRNANLVIGNAPNGTNISAQDLASFMAQAKFLRAFTYFHIVRNWGKAILRTEANLMDQHLPLSSAADVYKLILEDLVYAEQNLPDGAALPGRPTKWSAKTLLADVYFYTNDNQKASEKAAEVIQSGKYQLVAVRVSEDFQRIFGPEVINTTEEIFYLKYNRQSGWAFPSFAHHPGSSYYNFNGVYGHYTDSKLNKVYREWDDKDLRKQHNWYSWDIGLGANSLLNRKFRDPGRVSAGANDCPLYRYADVLLIHAEASARAAGAPTQAGMESLNKVHRRAYGYDAATPSIVDFKLSDYNLNSFVDLVIKERGYETQYEGKRWLDLKRTGRVKEIIKAAVGKDVADKHLLWPIPISELNFNEAIDPLKDQNPGY